MTAETIAVDTYDEPDDDTVMEQIEQALDRAGVPLAPLAASAGWVSSLAGAALYGAGGAAGLVVAGLGAACATAAAGKRYRRAGSARRAGAGWQAVARHSSSGLSGGSGRRSGGRLLGGSSGGGRRGGGSSGGGGRSARLFSGGSAGRSGAGRLGLPSLGSGRKGSGSSGGGRSSGSSGRSPGGGRFGLGRKGSGGGLSGGSGGGRGLSSGRAGRLRTMLGRGGRPSGTGGGSTGAGTTPSRRRLFGRVPGAPSRPGAGSAPASGSPAAASRPRGWRRFKGVWPPPKPHPNAEPRFASDRRSRKRANPRPVGDTVADPKRATATARPAPQAADRPKRKPSTPPGARGKTSTTSGGTMGKLRIVELSEELAASVAALNVEPGEMYDLLLEMDVALERTTENIAQLWKNLASAIRQKMPLHPAASEVMDTVVKAQVHVGATAGEWPGLVRRIHQPDIDRFENPRTNERAWNVR